MIDQVWANAAIESCLQNGIDHFFLAPGSRCTPLTLAVARKITSCTIVQHFDERGLAFAALGYGRATGRPGVFICTSGTAVANAYPAVIEAAMENVPLLLMTADRPTELRGTGANQTIDQKAIFGSYPELFLDLPAPDESEAFPVEVLQQAFGATADGPVHLNWMFREPFTIDAPVSTGQYQPAAVRRRESAASELTTSQPVQIELSGNTLIALGGGNPSEAEQALELARRFNCPILSDITSGLKTSSFELPTEFDLPTPDTILHLGGRIVSKSWHQWTESLAVEEVRFIHLTPTGKTINPNQLPVSLFKTALDDFESKVVGDRGSDDFLIAWQQASAKRDEVLRSQLSKTAELVEPAIAWCLSHLCPPDNGLFVGNSTPIRDMDWFGAVCSGTARLVEANRGASGIDGLLATASGYALGLKKPTTVLLGDLSALHDLNSLALVSKSGYPLTLVVINNQAGHIFDLLPVQRSKHFEQFFATPHELHFENAASMFGLAYSQITEMQDFRDSYQAALKTGKSIVLELITDRQKNQRVRQQIREEISKCQS